MALGALSGRFRFPGGDARTTVIGATGSGKTTNGVWMLAHQRFDRRPWIVVDFKREQIFDTIGLPPIRQIPLTGVPRRPGLYLVSPRPDQDDALEAWLWKVWERENIGLFVDEASLMPDRDAFRAILQQGRSKRIPLIACTQRPVDVKRGLFSEASYFCIYRMADKRDYKTVQGFIPADLSKPLPPFHWHWFDVARNVILHMGPVPRPNDVASLARSRIPHVHTWHPFGWTSEPTGRPLLKRA
jgi:hypothetical protein